MSDVFLSYSRKDLARARALAEALEARGWSVWWDREIPPGRTFDDVIEEALGQTKSVVVLWTASSAASNWVRTEADVGLGRGILIPVLMEPVEIPLAFRRIQAADLTTWDGSEPHEGLANLLATLEGRLGSSAAPEGRSEMPEGRGTLGEPEGKTWHAELVATELARRDIRIHLSESRHDLACIYRANQVWNNFTVEANGVAVAKGGHVYSNRIALSFTLADGTSEYSAQVEMTSGDTISTGEHLGSCRISVGGRVLYSE